ncbi:MAG TPA: cation transporter, partial [Dysgonamonadaceae bacterium]|nr:cation transporter [Dysgonamonadaceae bacterium]
KNKTMEKSKFEHAALKITGTAFYLLSLGLVVGSVMNIITRHKPETTRWGIIISVLSILIMYWLMRSKQKVGRELDSEPIMADANCTKICIYMSVVLLLSSLIYEVTGFAYADVIGSIGLIYFSVSEGKEAFEKSQGKECSCDS